MKMSLIFCLKACLFGYQMIRIWTLSDWGYFYHVYILSLVKRNEFDNTPCDLSYHSTTSGILFVITAETSSHSLQKLEVNILKSLLIDDRKV